MLNLAEYRQTADRLADHLPWAALVAPGVVLNKDGSFQRTLRFRGPDLESATEAELVGACARANNVLRRFGYPIAPVVIGLILGPLAEQQLRRALAISQGDPMILVHSPLAIGLYLVAAAAVLIPLYLRMRGKGEVLSQLAADED